MIPDGEEAIRVLRLNRWTQAEIMASAIGLMKKAELLYHVYVEGRFISRRIPSYRVPFIVQVRRNHRRRKNYLMLNKTL